MSTWKKHLAAHLPRHFKTLWLPVLAVLCLALTPAVASAARGHVFSGAFGEKGKGHGQFEEPAGIAVNESTGGPESGDVYVVDKGNDRVEVFNSKDEYQFEINGSGEQLNECNALHVCKAGSGGLPDEQETGRFAEPQGIAVDNSTNPSDPSKGDVYVVDPGHLVLNENLEEIPASVIDKFTATGEYVGQITAKSAKVPVPLPGLGVFFLKLTGVAVDPQGEVWVSEQHFTESFPEEAQGVDHFSNALANEWEGFHSAQVGGAFGATGLAVDSKDDVYIRNNLGTVAEFNSEGKLLNEAVGGESGKGVPPNGVATELSTGDVYIDNATSVGRFDPTGSPIERFGEGDLTGAGGLAVNSQTGEVYVADASGAVERFIKEPTATPLVQGESVSEVTDDSARFNAEVNPRSLAGEPATKYHFEYGACTSPSTCAASGYEHSVPVPDGVLAPSFDVDAVTEPVEGLTPGTAYHFRVVASNGDGPDEQVTEQTFSTRGVGAFALADGREWELVSPPDKHGSLIDAIGVAPIQASVDGAGITYSTGSPTESEPPGNSGVVQVLSTRTSAGWSSRDITVPHAVTTGISVGQGQEARFFSEDLSLGVVQPFGAFTPCTSQAGAPQPCISPEASEQTAFLRSDFANANPSEPEACTSACYRPLVTGKEPFANVPDGTVFGQTNADSGALCPPSVACGPEFVGGSPDLTHVVLHANVALTVTTPAAMHGGLYEWAAGKLQLVDWLPASEGKGEEPAGDGAILGLPESVASVDARHAVSDDGSRVFWTDGERGHLYMRDLATGKSLLVDAPEANCVTCNEGPVDPEFQGASSTGSRVFFTDTQKLKAEGGAYNEPRISESGQGADLYECEIVEDTCKLSDIAPSGAVLGSVLGTSEDGSWVYFVANGVLENGGVPVPGAVHGTCPNKSHVVLAARCNLYVRHGGVTGLVAVLSGGDLPEWSSSLVGLPARVSPDGGWLAFMSQRELTGYDNRDAVSGVRDEEVYLYSGVTGGVGCASCDPTGARPHGVAYGEVGVGAGVEAKIPLAGGSRVWPPSTWLAANIPGWTPYTEFSSLYQSRYLSNSGRLFFNASDALVPKDVDGTEDVYEYEPAGVPEGEHACSSATQGGGEVFKPEHAFNVEGQEHTEGAGCVALISNGESPQESAFLDASESGSDVFFMTTSKLAPQDFDDALDVYDAHECTTESPCLPSPAEQPPACTTEASCKAAPSPQPEIFGASGSATFSGVGNVTPAPVSKKVTKKAVKCRKGFVKNRKGKCVKKGRPPKKSRKAKGKRARK